MSSASEAEFAEAAGVLRVFLEASTRKDVETMRACLSRQTLESGQFHGDGPEGVEFFQGEAQADGDGLVIPVKAVPQGAGPDSTPVMEMACVMVREEGAWKLDLNATMERMMGGSLEAAVGQMADAMQQAVGGMADALSAGLSEAFGSGGDEAQPDWEQASLELEEDELLPLSRMTPLPKTQEVVSSAAGAPVIVQAAIKDLLAQVGSDQADVLIAWFEDQLFSEWGEIFSQAAARVPLAGRLHAVRIEAAQSPENRMVALDGSDLVYRMFINDNSGYYTSAELAEIVPGVLAGLPERIDDRAAGHRLLPTDEEYPGLDAYRQRGVPRWMRRISEQMQHPVELEVNWDAVHDETVTARKLACWGLNRIYGGLMLAGQDPELRAELAEGLTAIHIELGCSIPGRYARLNEGVLEIGLCQYVGEAGCFYEHQIARVLEGESIGPADGDEPSAEEPACETDLTDDARNDELFSQAVSSIREVEPMWRQQLDMVLGRPVELHVDFDSLQGRYDQVQPFVHQAVAGALGAISHIGFDPVCKSHLAQVQRVVIRAAMEGESAGAALNGQVLTLWAPLDRDGPPPIEELAQSIRGGPLGQTPAPEDDVYEQAARFMAQLESALRSAGLWPGDPPPDGFEVRGAFGCENMAFEQWLAWVLMDRVRQIIAERGQFPDGSNVAAYAVRSLDGAPGGSEVVQVLAEFDDFVNSLSK